jgi:hypothetical protein
MVGYRTDFLGDTVPAEFQTDVLGGAAAAAAIVADQVGGEVILDASTTDEAHSAISLSRSFRGDLNCVMIARVKGDLSTDTSIKIEVGFTDSHSDAGAVTLIGADPVTFRATDAALWIMDKDDNQTWQAAGVKAGVAATKIEPGTSIADATWQYLMVAIQEDTARFIHADADGGILYDSRWAMENAVTKTVLLTPWVFVQNRDGTQHSVDLDYIEVWQRRTTAS